MALVILHIEHTATDRCATVTTVILHEARQTLSERHHNDDYLVLFVLVEHSQLKLLSNFPLLTVVMHGPVRNH